MRFLKILKDSVFPLLCFIAMQLLALIIEPSKNYLSESFFNGKDVISSLFTGAIYNLFVFSVYLLLFCVYFIKFRRPSMAYSYRVCQSYRILYKS